MNSTKFVILVLILIVVIFVVFVTRGSLTEDQPKAGNQGEAKKFTSENKAPNWSETLQTSFDWLKPKLKIHCGQETEAEKCENLQSKNPLTISSDSNQPFRLAKFRAPNSADITSTVNICYRAATAQISCNEAKERAEEGGSIDFKTQSFDLPNFDSKNPREGTIVVLKEGGTITIICKSPGPCKVDLVE